MNSIQSIPYIQWHRPNILMETPSTTQKVLESSPIESVVSKVAEKIILTPDQRIELKRVRRNAYYKANKKQIKATRIKRYDKLSIEMKESKSKLHIEKPQRRNSRRELESMGVDLTGYSRHKIYYLANLERQRKKGRDYSRRDDVREKKKNKYWKNLKL